MGSHGLHWSLCLFKIIYYGLKRYNTIKCKMFCNFIILAGMDISCAVDCGNTWLPGCVRRTQGNCSQCFQWGLVVSWVCMILYTYVVCSLYVFQFWRSWPVLLGYTCLTSVCTVFHQGGNSCFIIFGCKNSQFSLYSQTSVHEHLRSWTIWFTNKFSEHKASRMMCCILSYEHTSRQHGGAISWEYQRRQYS